MNYKLLLGVCGFAVSALGMADVAAAQDAAAPANNAELGDIVVTAQRREQSLQSVPLAVSAIGAEALRNRNVASLGDLSNGAVPGLRISPFSGTPSILAITARGVGLSDPTQGTQELAVPLYIDGIPLGRAQGLGLELIDPERIEFLRGPQGQLFGRNAEGGAVQFVSRRPSGEFGFDGTAAVGNFNMNREKARVDLPEIGGIRLQGSIVHNHHDAFTVNGPKGVYSQQADYGYLDSFGYRIAAEWSPVEGLRLNYAYDNTDIKDSQPYLHWVPVDIIGRTPSSPQPAFTGTYLSQTNSPTFNELFDTKSSGHGLTIQYDATQNIVLKSISSYRQASRHGSSTLGDALVAGGSSTGILRTNAREDVDQKQWYQEVQAIGTWDNFNITMGGTYFKEKVNDRRRSYITGPGLNRPALGISPGSLAGCVGLETCLTAHSEQNATSDSYGLYTQATYTPPVLDGKLELTAGIRYSDDKKVAVRTYIQPLLLPPYTEAQPSGALPASPALFREKRWDPAFTVKYNFTDQINAYFRFARAYRAGGANVRSSTFTSYGSEQVTAYEIGLKSRLLDDRLVLNIAAYQNNIKNLQLNIQEQPITNPSLTNTVNLPGTLKVRGIEVESNVRVTNQLTLSATYSYMDAPKWQQFDNPLTATVGDITRFYSLQTPEHSGSFAADYQSPSLGFGSVNAHLDYSWSTGYWTTPGGLLVASLGANYHRPQTKTRMLNGRLALKDLAVGSGVKAEVAVFGKNILDDTHYTYAFDGAAAGGGYGMFLVEPRTYGVELRVRY